MLLLLVSLLCCSCLPTESIIPGSYNPNSNTSTIPNPEALNSTTPTPEIPSSTTLTPELEASNLTTLTPEASNLTTLTPKASNLTTLTPEAPNSTTTTTELSTAGYLVAMKVSGVVSGVSISLGIVGVICLIVSYKKRKPRNSQDAKLEMQVICHKEGDCKSLCSVGSHPYQCKCSNGTYFMMTSNNEVIFKTSGSISEYSV